MRLHRIERGANEESRVTIPIAVLISRKGVKAALSFGLIYTLYE